MMNIPICVQLGNKCIFNAEKDASNLSLQVRFTLKAMRDYISPICERDKRMEI